MKTTYINMLIVDGLEVSFLFKTEGQLDICFNGNTAVEMQENREACLRAFSRSLQQACDDTKSIYLSMQFIITRGSYS